MRCGEIKFLLITISTCLTLPLVSANEWPGTAPLSDVNVTATRIEKPLNEVPAAVGVVEVDDIQFATQQIGLDESLVKMPGIFMQNRYNFAQDLRVSIRGFGARSSFGIRGVKILVDGIPETLPDGQGSVDSIDIGASERIEVIRGPVSSLYGNASGGAILVNSEAPPDTPFVSLRPSLGADGFQKHQLKLGGKKDKLGYLVNFSDLDYDGYRDNSHIEATQVNSKFEYAINDASAFTTVLNHTDSPVADDPGGLTAEQVAENPKQARDRNVAFNSGESVKQTRLGFVYENDITDAGTLMVRNYYVWRDFNNYLPFVGGGSVDLTRFFWGGGVQYTHQSQLAGRDNRITVGIDLEQQDDDRLRYDNNEGVRGDLVFDQNEKVSSVGLFLQDEFSINEKLQLTAGARYDQVTFDVSDHYLVNGDDSGKRTLEEISPSLSLGYQPDDAINLYASVSTAFETPTTTEFANPAGGGFNPALSPQNAINYEIGAKSKINENNQYEIALFHIDVKDELIPYELADQPDREFFENAGESSRQGIEFLFATQPAEGMNASLAYTWSDFTFDNFTDDNGNDYSGNTIPGIPEHTIHADINYTHKTGLFAYFDVLYVDKVYLDNANEAKDDSYAVSNLRLGYSKFFGNWELSPFLGVNNLFDESYNSNVRINAFGDRFFEPAPERNAYGGVTLRYDFDV